MKTKEDGKIERYMVGNNQTTMKNDEDKGNRVGEPITTKRMKQLGNNEAFRRVGGDGEEDP